MPVRLYPWPITGSEWIVLLPLVGAIAGGFRGAWANSRFRGREAKKAEKEERNSLVFLIDTEVGFNVMRLGGASKGPPSNVIPHLRTDFWDASQARLAHLLPTGDMKVLAPYYEQIRMLKELDDIAAKDDPRQLSDSEWTPMQGTQDGGLLFRRWSRDMYGTWNTET